jgi:hypothetical protein
MGYSLSKFSGNEVYSIQKKIITIPAGEKKLLITNVHILIYFVASEFIRSLLPFGLEN